MFYRTHYTTNRQRKQVLCRNFVPSNPPLRTTEKLRVAFSIDSTQHRADFTALGHRPFFVKFFRLDHLEIFLSFTVLIICGKYITTRYTTRIPTAPYIYQYV